MAAAEAEATRVAPAALWYGALLGGLAPILLSAFLASAVADRTVFVAWGLALGTAWTVLLHQGLAAGWPGRVLAGALALLLGVGLAAFGGLLVRHGEALDLGLRATLPVGAVAAGTDRLAVARPAAALVPATALAAAGALLLAAGRGR